MCGRFNNHLPKMLGWAEMLSNWPNVPMSFNVAPSNSIAAFTLDENDQLAGHAMRWGMVPSWSQTFDCKYATFNARLESVAEKATFRYAWKQQQRCLIPLAGYYEWQKAGSDKATQRISHAKQPFYITDRQAGGLVAAGLYEKWGSTEQPALSCTMITRSADLGLDKLHARMPALLTPNGGKRWLAIDHQLAEQFLANTASPELVYWPVVPAVGNVHNNDKRLCEPIDL